LEIILNSEPYEEIFKRTTQGIFLQQFSTVGVIVYEKKMLKRKVEVDAYTDMLMRGPGIRST
jgi:hypothetical protein